MFCRFFWPPTYFEVQILHNLVLNNDIKFFSKGPKVGSLSIYLYIFLGNNWTKSIAWKGRWEKKNQSPQIVER